MEVGSGGRKEALEEGRRKDEVPRKVKNGKSRFLRKDKRKRLGRYDGEVFEVYLFVIRGTVCKRDCPARHILPCSSIRLLLSTPPSCLPCSSLLHPCTFYPSHPHLLFSSCDFPTNTHLIINQLYPQLALSPSTTQLLPRSYH